MGEVGQMSDEDDELKVLDGLDDLAAFDDIDVERENEENVYVNILRQSWINERGAGDWRLCSLRVRYLTLRWLQVPPSCWCTKKG